MKKIIFIIGLLSCYLTAEGQKYAIGAVSDTGFVRVLSNGRTTALTATQMATLFGGGTIADNSVTFAKMQDIATDRLIGRDAAGTGDPAEISLNATLEWTGSNSIQRAALTGDITATAGSNATAISSGVIVDADVNASAAIALSKLATQAALSVVTNATNATAVPTAVAAANDGEVFRRSGTALAFGTIATLGIADGAITNAKIADVSAAKLTSGTVPSSFVITSTNSSTVRWNYNGGTTAFTLDDINSTASFFSEDGTQYFSASNTLSSIGSGTSKLEFIDGLLRVYDSDATQFVGIQTPATGSLTTSYTLTLPTDDGTSGQFLQTDGSGGTSWVTGGTGNVTQGGNSFGAAMTIGTNDANALNFETDNVVRATVSSSGTLSVGSSSPVSISNTGTIGSTSYTFGTTSGTTTIGGNTGGISMYTTGTGGSIELLSSSTSSTGFVLSAAQVNTAAATISIGSAGDPASNSSGDKAGMTFREGYALSSGSGNYTTLKISNTINQTSTASGTMRGIEIAPTLTSVTGAYRAVDIAANGSLVKGVYQSGSSSTNNLVGKTTFGATTAPTALLMLAAGTSSANTAPLKFTSGTNLSTVENGAVEYDGTNYFVSSGSTRYTLAKVLTGSATLDFASQTGSAQELTITVTGATAGDEVLLGIPNAAVTTVGTFTARVSAANTVSVKFSNPSLSAENPASATFKVAVLKR